MLAFLISFLMGVAFIVLLKFLLRVLSEENKKQTLIFFVSLFALCGVFSVVAIWNIWYIVHCFCGFLSGCAVSAAGVYIYKSIIKRFYRKDIEFLKKKAKELLDIKKWEIIKK